MYKKISLFILFLFVVQACPNVLDVTVIKRGTSATSFGPVQPLYKEFVHALDQTKFFKVRDDLDMEKQLGIPMTPDFAQIIDPINLYEIKDDIDLDVVIFFVADTKEIRISTLEFPTGIVLNEHKFAIPASNPESLGKNIETHAGVLATLISSKQSADGFAFNDDDFGLLICADNIHQIDVAKTLDLVNRKYFENKDLSLVRSLKNRIIKRRNVSCEQLQDLCGDLNAELGFYFSTKSSEPHLVVYSLPKPADVLTHAVFPMVPALTGLECYSPKIQDYSAESVVSVLLDHDLNNIDKQELLPLYFYRVFRLHSEWKMGYNRSDDNINRINQFYQNIENIAQEQSLQKAWTSLNHAAFCRMVYDFDKARTLLTSARGLFLLHYDNNGELLCRLELAKIHAMQNNWQEAEEIYSRILRKEATKIDSTSMADIYYELGQIYELAGKHDDAVKNYEKSLSVYAHNKDSFSAMTPQLKLGQLYRKMNEFTKAEQSMDRYLTIANTLQSEPDVARARYELGLVHLGQNDLEKAQNDFIMAQDMFEMLGDMQYPAFIHLNMGVVYLKNKQFVKANLSLNDAINYAKETRDYAVQVDACRYLGDAESTMENWDRAQAYYDQGIDLAIEKGLMEKVALVMYQKGLSHLQQGKVSIGYVEVKKGIELSNGRVYGDREQAEKFLRNLEKVIAAKNAEMLNH